MARLYRLDRQSVRRCLWAVHYNPCIGVLLSELCKTFLRTSSQLYFTVMKSAFLAVFLAFASCCLCEAAVPCPSTDSTSPLSCFSGTTYNGFITALPWCQCNCTQGSTPSELEYYPITTGLSCNRTLCSFYRPYACGNGITVATVPLTYAQVAAAQMPTIKPMSTVGVCLTMTLNCTQDMVNDGSYPSCNSALLGTSETSYGWADATSCAAFFSNGYSFISGYGCNTNKCNAPPNWSASTLLKPSVYLFFVVASLAAYF